MKESFLEHLDWRFATKDFDPDKKLSDKQLAEILRAVQMAPSSYGFQPYHVYVVGDPNVKKQLREAGYDQSQFEEASHVLVFCSRNDLEDRKDLMIEAKTGGDEEKKKKLAGFIKMLDSFLEGMKGEKAWDWAHRQTYIALGFALAACAEMQVDSCPMEGFESKKFDEILQVPSHMKSVVVMSVGFRVHSPKHPKFRFESGDLFTKI